MRQIVRYLILILPLAALIAVWVITRETSAGAYFALGFCAAFFAFACFILFPLGKIHSWLRQIQSGNLAEPPGLPPSGGDIIAQLAASVRNLTASRRLFNERLLRAEQTTRAALNALPHAVALLSPDGKIELANAPARSLFALTPDADADASPHPWLPPLLHHALDSKLPAETPTVQIFDQGRELFFLPRAIPILAPDQSVAGILLLLIDATQLRQVDEAKSGLLASLSHELKTPLTSIQMSLHLLLDAPPPSLSPMQLELLKTARDDADRLHHLIQTILDAGQKSSQ